jgi:hypothetical protein
MIIGTHRLNEHQARVVESAQAELMTSRQDDFLKYIGDGLRGQLQIRDSMLRHIVCSALVKFGARRGLD